MHHRLHFVFRSASRAHEQGKIQMSVIDISCVVTIKRTCTLRWPVSVHTGDTYLQILSSMLPILYGLPQMQIDLSLSCLL